VVERDRDPLVEVEFGSSRTATINQQGARQIRFAGFVARQERAFAYTDYVSNIPSGRRRIMSWASAFLGRADNVASLAPEFSARCFFDAAVKEADMLRQIPT